jgi:hypothetical protein
MYELIGLISIVLGISFFVVYGQALHLTLSKGAPSFLTGAWLLWGLPLLGTIPMLFSDKWRAALAIELIFLAVATSCWLGSRIARWMRRDSFEGAILGGFTGLFVTGWPITHALIG